jgi:hypothetical protein
MVAGVMGAGTLRLLGWAGRHYNLTDEEEESGEGRKATVSGDSSRCLGPHLCLWVGSILFTSLEEAFNDPAVRDAAILSVVYFL